MIQGRIRCLAVDDDEPALGVIRKYIENVPGFELTATCDNAIEALAVLQQKPIDLLFLDIQMPKILGTDFIRTLKTPPKVIFTTAYRKFAVEGFDLDAVDFLLKPISFERFLKAVNKIMERSDPGATPGMRDEKQIQSGNWFIEVKSNRTTIKVSLDDILYIESLKDYAKVVTVTRTIITKQPISSFETMLPMHDFIRIHRAFIVSLAKIESHTHGEIGINNGHLPVGRTYKNELIKKLKTRRA
jgi:DNA-binding LytR/AlgR family response regulator